MCSQICAKFEPLGIADEGNTVCLALISFVDFSIKNGGKKA